MTAERSNLSNLELAGVQPIKTYRVRSAAAIILALSPPTVCALLASSSGRWDLFERSGSITTAIGLLLASRRYIRYGVRELALLHAQKLQAEVTEIYEDIFTAKRGLALSAVGTIIWGWGTYLRWWSFSCLLVWALFALLDSRRDFNRARAMIAPGDAGSGEPCALNMSGDDALQQRASSHSTHQQQTDNDFR